MTMNTEEVKPVATRQAYGEALLQAGQKHDNLVVLDADLSGSTGTAKFAKAYPDRFFNMGIAEQNMISTAAGLSTTGYIPFASSFAMFAMGRAWEQVRNSVAHNNFNVKIAATHAGITLGQDGASHQIIEDLALSSAIPGMTVLVPADATEASQMVSALIRHRGPAYLRLGRNPVPVLSSMRDYEFEIGKAQLLQKGKDITIIAIGVMVHIALEAARRLAQQGVEVELINLSTVKPLDERAILESIAHTRCLLVAEEHNYVGGVNQMIAGLIARKSDMYCPMEVVAIQDRFGQSGTASELLTEYGLTAEAICEHAKIAIQRNNP